MGWSSCGGSLPLPYLRSSFGTRSFFTGSFIAPPCGFSYGIRTHG
jgi:hypothetical protein